MKAKAFLTAGIILLIPSLVFISCSREKSDWQGSIEVVDGVTVVKNPKEPICYEKNFCLEEELSIGRAEGKEEYLFSNIYIDVDKDGNIYVLDRKTSCIRVFNNNGIFMRKFGERGQGPGEMQTPISIQVTPQGEIMIHDAGARRLIFFLLKANILVRSQLQKFMP